MVKTPPFHGGNMGSSPVRVTKKETSERMSLFLVNRPAGLERSNPTVRWGRLRPPPVAEAREQKGVAATRRLASAACRHADRAAVATVKPLRPVQTLVDSLVRAANANDSPRRKTAFCSFQRNPPLRVGEILLRNVKYAFGV